jgi:nucleoside-diphosphate-sugar epimerase
MKEKKGTILLTGASGFIGKVTETELLNNNWQIIKTSRSLNINEAGTLYFDLSCPEKSFSEIMKLDFDIIVHLGAKVGLSNFESESLFTENVFATSCLVEIAKRKKKKIVYASTAIVHGVNTELISKEKEEKPDTHYAKTKLLGEKLITNACDNYCILRLGGVFGFGSVNVLGVNKSIINALRGRPPILKCEANRIRNYVYVNDVAKQIRFAVEENIVGVHLISGSEQIEIGKMLQIICDSFIPGSFPIVEIENEGHNQIIIKSNFFPETCKFEEAIQDLRRNLK